MNAPTKNMISILKVVLSLLLNISMQKKHRCFLMLFILKKKMTNIFLNLRCNIMMAMANNYFHLLIILIPLKAARMFPVLNLH